MSKMKKKKMNDTKLAKTIAVQKKYMGKHGKIKCKDKKKRKLVRATCLHVYFNKKGKAISTLIPGRDENDNPIMICERCGEEFPTHIYGKKELKEEIVNPMEAVNNQMKYMATVYGCGAKIVDYFAQFSAMLSVYSKSYSRVAKIAKKKKDFDSKRSKKKSVVNSPGDWSRVRNG